MLAKDRTGWDIFAGARVRIDPEPWEGIEQPSYRGDVLRVQPRYHGRSKPGDPVVLVIREEGSGRSRYADASYATVIKPRMAGRRA